jgi:hypothetical protein
MYLCDQYLWVEKITHCHSVPASTTASFDRLSSSLRIICCLLLSQAETLLFEFRLFRGIDCIQAALLGNL